MEFERLVSSLDAEARARAAETLLRTLSGGTAERASALSDPASWRGSRANASLSLSASGASTPLSGAEGGRRSALEAAEALSSSAVPGGTAEEAARAEQRPDLSSERWPRSPGPVAAEELARLEERLAAVSEQNRRVFGQGQGVGMAVETDPPYASADDPAADAAATGAERSPAFSAPRTGFGAAAVLGGTDTETARRAAAPAARDFFDAEAVSEFFRRDSRRYDSGFSD